MIDINNINISAHALLFTKEGKVILQQRDNDPHILSPGLVAIFGGSVNLGESIDSGLRRELAEELELDIDGLPVEKLGIFAKTKEMDKVDCTIHVFVVRNVDVSSLKLHEGKGLVCDFPSEILKLNKLTRIVRLALQSYIERL